MENVQTQTSYEVFVAQMGEWLKAQKKELENSKQKFSEEIIEMQHKNLVAQANKFALYVKKECSTNSDFNSLVSADWKSVNRLMKFINEKARKLAVNGCACVDDDIVYDWVTEYYFLDDEKEVKAEREAKAKAKAEKEAREKAEAERKAKAEKEALDELQNDEAYNNATEEEKKKLIDEKVKELIKKAERKAKADERKAKKAAEERAKAVKRLEDAGAFTDSTSEAEKEKMIEQTIKRIRKEEREAKKAEKEAKAKKEAERDTSIEANMPEKSAHEIANAIAADFEEQEKAEAEAKPAPTPEPSPRDKAIAEATKILEFCRAEEVIKLYKHSFLEEFSDVELDNLITHKDQVIARYGKVS